MIINKENKFPLNILISVYYDTIDKSEFVIFDILINRKL